MDEVIIAVGLNENVTREQMARERGREVASVATLRQRFAPLERRARS